MPIGATGAAEGAGPPELGSPRQAARSSAASATAAARDREGVSVMRVRLVDRDMGGNLTEASHPP
jgi:hypothetical protein